VARGDAVAFDRQAAVSAELYEFGVCADLLDEALPYLMVSGREVER
jgi:hypothetical protein